MSDIIIEDLLGEDESGGVVDLEKRRIVINDEIGASIVEKAIIPLIDMDSDESGEPIEIYINTVGGSVGDGLVLCNIIDNLKTPTTIIALGYAYSMGAIILAAGKHNPNVKKVCYKFSSALIHDGYTTLEGGSGNVADTYEFIQSMERKIRQYLIDNTNIPAEQYEVMERKECYMDANAMLAAGLVDEII